MKNMVHLFWLSLIVLPLNINASELSTDQGSILFGCQGASSSLEGQISKNGSQMEITFQVNIWTHDETYLYERSGIAAKLTDGSIEYIDPKNKPKSDGVIIGIKIRQTEGQHSPFSKLSINGQEFYESCNFF